MNVLFVASECAPFIKTGGLADVVSALPKALAELGVSVRVMLPAYPALAALVAGGAEVLSFEMWTGPVRVVAARAGQLDLLLVESEHLFDRGGNPYGGRNGDYPDNHVRFGALSRAGAEVAWNGADGWVPDIVHAHDWQAGLAPAFLKLGPPTRTRAVTTIHNIAFQGSFPQWAIADVGLPPSGFTVEGYEYYGGISFLKAGLMYADRITTVSPTYAREITTPAFGMGFEGILSSRRDRLTGILNGVELDVWNPATDALLGATYDAGDLAAREANRTALRERFGLTLAPEAPVFCVVSRLTWQKGIDLLVAALPRLLARGAGLVVLGSGDRELEDALHAAAHRYAGQVGLEVGYDEALSHRMQGGADVILVPSRFEPCGLTQLYGLRYGCLPLVARTGGLADTVIDANEAALAAGTGTGFQFAPVTAEALADAIDRACDAFADRDLWRSMMVRAMGHPVGWETSAAAYRGLYDDVLAEP